MRRRILLAFERAERETDPARRAALLTFVIVGAGPTGVELAGTIAELAHDTLRGDFRNIDTQQGARGADRGGPARARRLSPRPLGLCAGARWRSSASRSCWGRPSPRSTAEGVVFGGKRLRRQDDHLGRRRARLARRRMAGRAGRPRRARAGRARPDRARPSRDLRHRRHRAHQRPGRQAGARHRAGRQAAGPPCRRDHQGAAARRDAAGRSATSTPAASRRSASGRGDRFRLDQAARRASPGGSGASPTSIS